MRKTPKPFSAPIDRSGKVSIPVGLCRARLGQRVYFELRPDRSVAIRVRPWRFKAPKFISARVKRGTLIKKPSRNGTAAT